MTTACNHCDRRDCPAIEFARVLTPEHLDQLFDEGMPVTFAKNALRAVLACRNNLRADLEVVHESIADLINDGAVPPPLCAWCMHGFVSREEVQAHLLTCAKHPLVILAEKRRVALEAAREFLDRETMGEGRGLRDLIEAALKPAELPALPTSAPTTTLSEIPKETPP